MGRINDHMGIASAHRHINAPQAEASRERGLSRAGISSAPFNLVTGAQLVPAPAAGHCRLLLQVPLET
jgi:hypothetical protein